MDRALASSGLLVVAVDLTLASEAPYPACVQDANHAVRWLKANAARWNGDVSKLGVYGSSSGGHVAELLAMRPHDPRYSAIPLVGAPSVDATVSWVAMRSPPSNTIARFENAERRKNETMIQSNKTFFSPWASIHEGNPQEILDRGEKVTLVPFLIMQGALDDNVLPAMQEKFAESYRAAGGQCDYRLFAEIGPRMKRHNEARDCSGGYTRIIKTPDRRLGDGGLIAILQFVGENDVARPKSTDKTGRKRRATVRYSFYAGKPLPRRGRRSEKKADKPAKRAKAEKSAPTQSE